MTPNDPPSVDHIRSAWTRARSAFRSPSLAVGLVTFAFVSAIFDNLISACIAGFLAAAVIVYSYLSLTPDRRDRGNSSSTAGAERGQDVRGTVVVYSTSPFTISLVRGSKNRDLVSGSVKSRRRLGLEVPVLCVLMFVSGVTAWHLFISSGEVPQSPLVHHDEPGGIAMLVDRPHVKSALGLNCEIYGGGPPSRWCVVWISFAPSVKPGTRWLLAFAHGIQPEGRGTLIHGKAVVKGRRISQSFPGERFPVGETTHFYRPKPLDLPGASVVGAGGVVVTGVVHSSGISSSWTPKDKRPYHGIIPLAWPYSRGSYVGVRLPASEVASRNGITAGQFPTLGAAGDGYFLVDNPHDTWQSPDAKYFANALEPNIEDQLLGDLRTSPPTVGDRKLSWIQNEPFQARWVFSQPSQLSDARRETFISGALLSISAGFLVALMQVLARRRGRADQVQ